LHDTYGFPVEVTREVLAERGLSLDEAGFEAAMGAQRERAREAMQGYDRVVAAFRDQEIRSRFVGYEREQVETRIVAIEPVPDADGEVYVVLAENPSTPPAAGRSPTRVGSPRRTDSSKSSMRSRPATTRSSGPGSSEVRSRSGTL
jgi:alanyl-tRNA synthetase